jgi:hypothetical protein
MSTKQANIAKYLVLVKKSGKKRQNNVELM